MWHGPRVRRPRSSARARSDLRPGGWCRAAAPTVTRTRSSTRCMSRRHGRRPPENRLLSVPKPPPRALRPYRYLRIPEDDRENPHLVRERVRCGKPSCGCARDVKRRHGPCRYLRFEESDRRTGQTRYRRECVPRSELARVRRWIRRSRAASRSHARSLSLRGARGSSGTRIMTHQRGRWRSRRQFA